MSAGPLVVALTGGIASGKSAVAECFAASGITVFDADVAARTLVKPGAPALIEITKTFGTSVLTAAGELDRARMRSLVFGDAVERRRLEAILHPRVRDALLDSVGECTSPYCLLVIPLLVEVRADYTFVERVLVTHVSPAMQIERLMRRDRCTLAEAEQIVAAQAPREARLALADDVIDNDGDVTLLAPMVARLHAHYVRLAAAKV